MSERLQEVGRWKEPVMDRAWLIEDERIWSRYVTENETLVERERKLGRTVTPVTATLRVRTPEAP